MISFNLGMEVYILYDKVSYELKKGASSHNLIRRPIFIVNSPKSPSMDFIIKTDVEFESAVCKYNAIPAHISAIPFGGDCIVCRQVGSSVQDVSGVRLENTTSANICLPH